MNASQFGDKYGKKYLKKIRHWYDCGYLGNATRDEKTGVYEIPDDIPLPYSANANVSTMPTLMRDILLAASGCCSLYPSMYPKIKKASFDRMIQECVDANLIDICYTESGDQYLELNPLGLEFLNNTTEDERKLIFEKTYKLIIAGSTLLGALANLGILLQGFL